MRYGLSIALLSIASFVGCHSAMQPEGIATVRVMDANAIVTNDSADIRIGFSVENAGQTSILFDTCGSIIERQNGNGWSLVWHVSCFLASDHRIREIRAGEVLRDTLSLLEFHRGEFSGSDWPYSGLEGSYRVRLRLTTISASLLAPSDRLSSPFSFPVR